MLLRAGYPGDADALARIRKEPEVVRRWGDANIEEEIQEQFIGAENGFVIEMDGEIVGAIQYGEEDEPMYRHANVDIFLTTSHHGQGLGAEAVRVMARHLFGERDHHRLTIDPAVDNAPAIRAYERVGFRRVGIMRSYERGLDGSWHDGLLMEMLREEFRP